MKFKPEQSDPKAQALHHHASGSKKVKNTRGDQPTSFHTSYVCTSLGFSGRDSVPLGIPAHVQFLPVMVAAEDPVCHWTSCPYLGASTSKCSR